MSRKKTPKQVLQGAMDAKGWTPIQLAEASGVDVTLIRRYLEDDEEKRVDIGVKNAPRLADALGIEAAALVFGAKAAA